ncbi:hypothetical protein T265_01517, partial [Opisthorchis viverrini]
WSPHLFEATVRSIPGTIRDCCSNRLDLGRSSTKDGHRLRGTVRLFRSLALLFIWSFHFLGCMTFLWSNLKVYRSRC